MAAAGNGIYTAIRSVRALPHPANPTHASVSTAENTQHYFWNSDPKNLNLNTDRFQWVQRPLCTVGTKRFQWIRRSLCAAGEALFLKQGTQTTQTKFSTLRPAPTSRAPVPRSAPSGFNGSEDPCAPLGKIGEGKLNYPELGSDFLTTELK